jgi:hypothetical protein
MALTTIRDSGLASGVREWTESAAIGTLNSATHTVTGIPSNAREIVMTWKEVGNTNSANVNPKIRVGTSSGLVTSGYSFRGINHYVGGTAGMVYGTDSVANIGNWGSTAIYDIYCHLFHTGDNIWLASSVWNISVEYTAYYTMLGRIELSGTLDRIAMNVDSGTFSGGTARVFYR